MTEFKPQKHRGRKVNIHKITLLSCIFSFVPIGMAIAKMFVAKDHSMMRGADFFIMAGEEVLEAPEENKPPKSLKILVICGVAILLVGGGIAYLLLFAPKSEEDTTVLDRIKTLWKTEKKAPTPLHGYIYKMEPFLVNLVDPGQLRYLKITIHVESNQEKANEEYEKRLPQLRDAVLTILSSKNYKDIISAEGKTALREEIKAKLNQLSVSFKVQSIYFTEFVVQ